MSKSASSKAKPGFFGRRFRRGAADEQRASTDTLGNEVAAAVSSATLTSSREEQLRYLSQSVRLEERGTPLLIQSTITAASLMVVTFLVWASVANINELARAPGEVIPQGFEQVVQHLEGGIVKEILVTEGELVAKGAKLVVLDGSGAREDLARERKKHFLLSQQMERLSAYLDNREPSFGESSDGSTPGTGQLDFFKTMTEAREKERSVIRLQIEQQEETVRSLNDQRNALEQNKKLLKDLYERRQKLFKRGHIAYPQVVEIQVRMNSTDGEYQSTLKKIEQANHAISEFRQRLQLASATHRDQIHDRLERVRTELVQSEEVISKLEHRVERLEILSPVRGIIKGLVVNTISGVIQPGEPLMYIVPYDEALVVEARIPPQYIGRIHTGQAVQVSISSYDFARYGVLEGTLERVSATTFRDSRDGRYYKGRIRLSRSYVGAESENNRILPGMTVMANIVTGEKTVMDYMLKPIRTAVQSALSEH